MTGFTDSIPGVPEMTEAAFGSAEQRRTAPGIASPSDPAPPAGYPLSRMIEDARRFLRVRSYDSEERMVLRACVDALEKRITEERDVRSQIINTPETSDFIAGVALEATHQRERWGSEHDVGKTPFDWFWLIGYLAQKAASSAVAGDTDKAKHHTISTAAALGNWHAQISGRTDMRPGIGPGNGGEKLGSAYDLATKLDGLA